MSALSSRLAALEARKYEGRFTFTTTADRTVHVPIGDVLGVFLGDPLPPALRDVKGTPETAALARSVVQLAVAARERPADGQG